MENPKTKTTRLPAFLWDALQDVMYEQDHAFLRMVAPHVGISFVELKRALLGARGQLTTVAVADTALWWEGEFCPMRVRCPNTGLWRSCGQHREPHGMCGKHRGCVPSVDAKHKNDSYFAGLIQRRPFRFQGDVVWVGPDDVLDAEGEPIAGLRICPTSGILLTHLSEGVSEGVSEEEE